MTETIHSCSYYCHIPACIKAQRDELRDKLAAMQQPREWQELTRGEIESWDLPEKPTVAEFVWFVESKIKEKNQ
ncbi:MAG: hypothetical protein RLZZ481_375 [Pseudomonadota bacterium]|jgi:hypothetical protein